MTIGDELALLGFIAAALAAASSGVMFRPGAWYERLRKPSWRPPNWAFGPVWMILYAMIATSGWLVWREIGLTGAPLAWAIYGLQLVLNFAWSWIFFGRRRMGLAALELCALWLAIAANIAAFATIHTGAAWLLAPYLAWVSVALALNVAVWRLNRSTANEGGGGAAEAV